MRGLDELIERLQNVGDALEPESAIKLSETFQEVQYAAEDAMDGGDRSGHLQHVVQAAGAGVRDSGELRKVLRRLRAHAHKIARSASGRAG